MGWYGMVWDGRRVGGESGTCFAHLPMNVSKQRVRGQGSKRDFSVLPPRPKHLHWEKI